MRRIAIVGAGQAGLLNAHGLLKAGYAVDLYSDRTADQWFHESKPTGTAVRFGLALEYERELGLDYWQDYAPGIAGVNLVLCLRPGTPFLVMNGRFDTPAAAIDLRLQSKCWLDEFEARGGFLHVGKVDMARLDEIAAEHDLTIVAAGRGALSDLLSVDKERSVYDAPQRHLAMVTVANANDTRDMRRVPARFYELPTAGESVWTPYHHKDIGPCWNLFSEARLGGPMDLFQDVQSGHDVVAGFKRLIRAVYPWDWEWAKDMTLADPNGWLVGKITPTVRKPVGHLPSGRVVTFVGDAGMSFDPIGAQGANNGNKMARHLTNSIVEHGAGAFDAPWIESTFEQFFHDHGEAAFRFNNMLLEGLPQGAQEMLAAQFGSDGRANNASGRQKLADAFCANFVDPRLLTDVLSDPGKARELIARVTGQSAASAVAVGRGAIIWNQIRWRLGKKGSFGFQHESWR
ncbi:MAG: styrene monooxygenase/indole monooxygenase family protein [bacterium]